MRAFEVDTQSVPAANRSSKLVRAMLSKRALGFDPEAVPAKKRFRHNLADLCMSNDLSGSRAQSLFQDALAAGAAHVADLAAVGSSGKHRGNAHRDLVRRLMKHSSWPKPYWAGIRVWDLKKQVEYTAALPFWLPHELVKALCVRASLPAFLCQEGLCAETKANLERARQELQCEVLLATGLWGDSMPCNFDRSQSVQAFTLNFPGLTGDMGKLRLPLVAFNKQCLVKHNTLDDVCAVLAWSFAALARGAMPTQRHDSEPWRPNDYTRRLDANRPLGVRGVLAEVRGDWAFYKECFRFPQHNERAGCCFRCSCTPEQVRLVGKDAPWRQARLGHWDCLQRMQARGLRISPLFSSPTLRTECFLLDWLHVVDLGIGADILGNVMKMLLGKFPGSTETLRCQAMFRDIQTFYRKEKPSSCFDNMTPRMIWQPNQPPKLRGKGAEVRYLVPWAKQAAERLLDDDRGMEAAAKQVCVLLSGCYDALRTDTFDTSVLAERSRKMCLLLVALESVAPFPEWRIKPKLHLFQELAEMTGTCPSDCWLYRDEDFGGSLAQLSRRRGGHNRPHTTGLTVLTKFGAKHRVPCIV